MSNEHQEAHSRTHAPEPTPTSPVAAQHQADDIDAFNRELSRLEAQHGPLLNNTARDTIRQDQSARLSDLHARFDIDTSSRARQLSLGMKMASLFGALALAASAFYLFYRVWGLLDPWMQVVMLVSASLGMVAGTFWLHHSTRSPYYTQLAALVAFACFVLNLNMLGQVFNITPSDSAFVAWAALAFLMAYTFNLRSLQAMGIMCVVAFIAARCGTWAGMHWLYAGARPENLFPAAAVLLALPACIQHKQYPSFPPIYRIFGLLTLFIPVLILANWGTGSYLLHVDRALIEGSYQIMGFAGTALAVYFGIRYRLNDVVNTAATLFVLFLYTKFFDWWWDWLPKYLFFLIIGLSAIVILKVLMRLKNRPTWRREKTA